MIPDVNPLHLDALHRDLGKTIRHDLCGVRDVTCGTWRKSVGRCAYRIGGSRQLSVLLTTTPSDIHFWALTTSFWLCHVGKAPVGDCHLICPDAPLDRQPFSKLFGYASLVRLQIKSLSHRLSCEKRCLLCLQPSYLPAMQRRSFSRLWPLCPSSSLQAFAHIQRPWSLSTPILPDCLFH